MGKHNLAKDLAKVMGDIGEMRRILGPKTY